MQNIFSKKIFWGILVTIITLIAVYFRYHLITLMPGGLFPDEAANGLDINSMQQGHLQPFYERNNGREALFFYFLWLSISIFGRGPWQHHVVSAFFGVVTVVLVYLFSRKVFSLENPQDELTILKSRIIACVATFLTAVSVWPVVVSRTAFRANMVPMFVLLTIYFLMQTYLTVDAKKKVWFAIFTGASFALGFYTYIAFRIMVPLVAILILWPLGVQYLQKNLILIRNQYLLPLFALLVSFVVIISPLAFYFYSHPGSFSGRSSGVSIFNPDLNHGHIISTTVDVFKKSMLGYFTVGDLNWRHNASGEPFIFSWLSPFFGFGLFLITSLSLVYLIWPHKKPQFWKYFVLSGIFWALMLPSLTTAEGIPHGLRSVGAYPAAYIITAWALYEIVKKIVEFLGSIAKSLPAVGIRITQAVPIALAVIVLLLVPFHTYTAYFVKAYNTKENFDEFRSHLTPVSQWLLINGSKKTTYVVIDGFDNMTVEYLTTVDGAHPDNPKNQPYTRVEPDQAWKLQNLKDGNIVLFTARAQGEIRKFLQYHPEAQNFLELKSKFGSQDMVGYKIVKPVGQ